MLAEAIIESPKNFSPGLRASSALFLALAPGAVAWLIFFAPPGLQSALWPDPRTWFLPLALVLTAAGLLANANSFKKPATRLKGLISAPWAALPLFLAYSFCLPEAFLARRAPSILLAQVLTPPEAVIFTDRKVLYAAAWHHRRNDLIFAFEQGEMAYGLRRPEGRGRYIGGAAELGGRIRRELDAGRPVAVIASQRHEKDLIQALGGLEPEGFLKRGDFTWRLYRASHKHFFNGG